MNDYIDYIAKTEDFDAFAPGLPPRYYENTSESLSLKSFLKKPSKTEKEIKQQLEDCVANSIKFATKVMDKIDFYELPEEQAKEKLSKIGFEPEKLPKDFNEHVIVMNVPEKPEITIIRYVGPIFARWEKDKIEWKIFAAITEQEEVKILDARYGYNKSARKNYKSVKEFIFRSEIEPETFRVLIVEMKK
jgi:hypothetical protein